jgi:DUF3040 family protein
MNRQEQRALREIEKNLASEDPRLDDLLRTYGKSRWARIHRYAAWIAIPLAVLGFALGDVLLLVTAGLLASGAVLLGRYLR